MGIVEQKFKVGDWIENIKGSRHIECLTENRLNEITSFECIYDNYKLWKPNIGDFCWFYDKKKSLGQNVYPTFGKFIGLDEDGFYICSLVDVYHEEVFKHCEPFIGELPQFLLKKDT